MEQEELSIPLKQENVVRPCRGQYCHWAGLGYLNQHSVMDLCDWLDSGVLALSRILIII